MTAVEQCQDEIRRLFPCALIPIGSVKNAWFAVPETITVEKGGVSVTAIRNSVHPIPDTLIEDYLERYRNLLREGPEAVAADHLRHEFSINELLLWPYDDNFHEAAD